VAPYTAPINLNRTRPSVLLPTPLHSFSYFLPLFSYPLFFLEYKYLNQYRSGRESARGEQGPRDVEALLQPVALRQRQRGPRRPREPQQARKLFRIGKFRYFLAINYNISELYLFFFP